MVRLIIDQPYTQFILPLIDMYLGSILTNYKPINA